jgi:NAD(P)-dependent dehydrogenase (short-subunit alcohol dehydrogenase family)
MTPEEFHRVTDVTYLGFVHGTMAALRYMRPRDHGTIVQVGSALAYRSIPLQSAYCGAKHAIVGFTDSLRSELLYENSAIRLTVVHLPAMNTPQFTWARTRLPRKPRPAGTIYQPEVAADAIVHAAHHPEREYWLGASTDVAILGNMLAPELADRYLAANAIAGQQTSEPVDPDRPDNLFEPVPGVHAVHGAFGAQAKDSGMRLPGASMPALAAAGVVGLAVLLGFAAGRGSR